MLIEWIAIGCCVLIVPFKIYKYVKRKRWDNRPDPDFEKCLQDEINHAELYGWAYCMLENEALDFLYERYGERIYHKT